MIADKQLAGHLHRNEAMWKVWQERGVTAETEIAVDFHFYATKKPYIKRLVESLHRTGFEISVNITRTMLLFRAWEIEATESGRWTLEGLQQRTSELYGVAVKCGCSLEGLGAMMPTSHPGEGLLQ